MGDSLSHLDDLLQGVDSRNVGFLSPYGDLFSLKGGHNQKSPSKVPVFQ